MQARGRLILISVVMVAALATVGCEQSSSSSSSGGGHVTLTFWSMWNKGEPAQLVLDQAIKDFEQANSNVTVDVLWGGRDVLTKVRTALISGNPPDLVDKDADEMGAAIITPKQAEPVDDVLKSKIEGEQNTIADVVPRPYIDQFVEGGKAYLVPYTVISSGFFYNEKLFTQLGLTPPATWDDFLGVVQKLQAKGLTPLAEDNLDFLNAYYYTWLAMRHAGPGVLHKAAGDKSGAGWDNPALIQAARDLQGLVAMKPFEPGYDGSKWPGAQVEWAKGHAGMILIGSWVPGETQTYVPSDWTFRMFTFPQTSEGNQSVEAYLLGFSIPKGAKHADVAKKFISFFMNKQRLAGIATKSLNMTARKDIPAPAALNDMKKALDNAKSLNRVWDGLSFSYPGWWKAVFLPLDDQLFFGKISGDDFIRQLKQQSITYWQTHSK